MFYNAGDSRSIAEQVEYYHKAGKMPDWIYYQLNGKSAQENYADIMQKRQAAFMQEALQTEAEKELAATLEKTLEELLSDLENRP